MDRTLILVKPDAFARSLTGEIIARFERKGLRIVALRHMTVTRDLAEEHYAEHAQRPFFGELVDFITSAPIVAMVLEGQEAQAAATIRTLAGRTQQVMSGLAVLVDGQERTAIATTEVTFHPVDEELLAWYVATGEWRERSGGYAIQGAGSRLVAAVEGEIEN